MLSLVALPLRLFAGIVTVAVLVPLVGTLHHHEADHDGTRHHIEAAHGDHHPSMGELDERQTAQGLKLPTAALPATTPEPDRTATPLGPAVAHEVSTHPPRAPPASTQARAPPAS